MHESASQHAARPQLQSFFVPSFGRERCLVTSLPIVRQTISGQATRKDKNLRPRMRPVVLLISTAIREPLRQTLKKNVAHGIICVQYAGTLHSCVTYRVPARVNRPSYSPLPCQACATSCVCSPAIVLRSRFAEEL